MSLNGSKSESHLRFFSTYIEQNRYVVLFALFCGVMAFGYEIFNFSLSIDEELKSFSGSGAEWVQQGRWSTFLLLNLFMPESLIPFLPTFYSVLFLIVSCMLIFYLIEGDNISKAIFCCFFMTFPSYAFFMQFNTYNFAVAFGIAAAISGVVFLKLFFEKEKRTYTIFVGAILVNAFAIGIYQSNIGIYVAATLLYMLSLLMDDREKDYKYTLKFSAFSIICLILSLFAYKAVDVVAKAALETTTASTYIGRFIGWQNGEILKTMAVVFKHIASHLCGLGFYGERYIILIWIVIFLLAFFLVKKEDDIKKIMLGLCFICFLVISPFLMSIVLGYPLPVRSLVGIPLMVAGAWYLLAKAVGARVKRYMLALAVLIAISHSFYITRLFYTDYLTAQADRDFANRIIDRVLQLNINFDNNSSVPIAFIGKHSYNHGIAAVRSELFGSSFFEFGGPSQGRIISFLKLLGAQEFVAASRDQYAYAVKESTKMKRWPHAESIAYAGGIVVVNLSEPTVKQITGSTH